MMSISLPGFFQQVQLPHRLQRKPKRITQVLCNAVSWVGDSFCGRDVFFLAVDLCETSLFIPIGDIREIEMLDYF